MQNQDYPLIFIVEDNSIYNKFITNHLKAKKFNRIESFLSGEECLMNLHKKPNIVIQDYLLNGISGLDVLKTSKQTNPDSEFIFLSGQDNLNIAVSTIKLGAFDYVVKDRFALEKLVSNIEKIMKIQSEKFRNKKGKISLSFLFIALTILIVSLVGLVIIFPKTFSF